MSVRITRKVEFDAGHRIPDHASKCKNVHGHRYVLEASFEGELIQEGEETGMVADFGNVKQILETAVAGRWDHAFLVWVKDGPMLRALAQLQRGSEDAPSWQHKTIVLGDVPTVENLVMIAARLIKDEMQRRNLTSRLAAIRLYETPNCWADWFAQDQGVNLNG